MIVVHFINPSKHGNKYEYHLIILKDGNELVRSIISTKNNDLETLQNIAINNLNDYCFEHNSKEGLLPEEHINYSLDEMLVDSPDEV